MAQQLAIENQQEYKTRGERRRNAQEKRKQNRMDAIQFAMAMANKKNYFTRLFKKEERFKRCVYGRKERSAPCEFVIE